MAAAKRSGSKSNAPSGEGRLTHAASFATGDTLLIGCYTSVAGWKFPRVQLLTIEGLLFGKQRAEHPDHALDLNFKKAKEEAHGKQKDLI